jgi:hypothetical protein
MMHASKCTREPFVYAHHNSVLVHFGRLHSSRWITVTAERVQCMHIISLFNASRAKCLTSSIHTSHHLKPFDICASSFVPYTLCRENFSGFTKSIDEMRRTSISSSLAHGIWHLLNSKSPSDGYRHEYLNNTQRFRGRRTPHSRACSRE